MYSLFMNVDHPTKFNVVVSAIVLYVNIRINALGIQITGPPHITFYRCGNNPV